MTSKKALLLLAAIVAAFFAPLLTRAEVIFPHDNAIDLGIRDAPPSARVENRKFTDLSSVYVPEIHHHLHGDRTSWLSTWTPQVELGRPTMQISGLSPAFPITRVLSWLTGDAYVLYTWLAVLTVALTALFGFLFLDALGLDRRASLAASVGLALGVYTIYWLSFVMYLASLCWTLCLLWAATKFIERPGAARGLWIAFAVYALLLAGYPQLVLWNLALSGGFLVLRARRWRTVLALGAWGALGVLCALPVVLDLALQAAASTRVGLDPGWFRDALPELGSRRDVGTFLAEVFDASWLGNPIDPSYPKTFKGVSLTPVVFALVSISWLDGGWRRTSWWLSFSLVCLLLTVWPQAYLFAAEHLGLGFSRLMPLTAALIPFGVCSAIAMDRLLRGEIRQRALAVAVAALGPAAALVGVLCAPIQIHGAFVAAGIVLFLLFASSVWSRRPSWIPALVVVPVFGYGSRMVLSRPESEIHRTSPLVERIRQETAGGLRYALVGFEDDWLLPSNQEMMLGLRSIQTYDPLASRAYRAWVPRISETGMRLSGRQFRKIASGSRLDRDEVELAGIGLFVSAIPLLSRRLADAGEVDGVRLYRTREKPALEAQVESFEDLGTDGARLAAPLSTQRRLAVERTEEHDDFLRFRLTPSEAATLLFVSQQFHPRWKARCASGALSTVAINGFWQGVLVPPGTEEVVLRFEPFSLWSWIPQAFFALAALAGATMTFLQGSNRAFAR